MSVAMREMDSVTVFLVSYIWSLCVVSLLVAAASVHGTPPLCQSGVPLAWPGCGAAVKFRQLNANSQTTALNRV